MFYDLNHCVDGLKDPSRREFLAMALQMGYMAVAATHTVTGIMADSDRCKIQPLKLDVLLAASPGVAESARFHRELLKVPAKLPFRQYSRITVVVDDQVQASALNPANPVLQTYDIVAVQPTNQKMFAQACTQMEADLISLDFTGKMQFRIKSANVKAAVERGIFFEISYGPALTDTRARRELFANTQTLVGVTRGRNIIVSSGAQNALEIRGPNDVANMSTLFGLSMEHAKAAISKNCKSVLLRGFARKRTYKAAIAIDHCQPDESVALFDVPTVWDPLSTADECLLPEVNILPDLSPITNFSMNERPSKEKIPDMAMGLEVENGVDRRPGQQEAVPAQQGRKRKNVAATTSQRSSRQNSRSELCTRKRFS